MVERYLGHRMLSVGSGLKIGMPIRIDNPRELGADRLVNAVAAHARFNGACISVDFGTAVTYDCVSETGEYLGGVIAPGVEVSLDALTMRGAKLPKIDLLPPRTAIGKSTVEAIRSGVIYGYAAQVDGIVGRLVREMDGEPDVIATGGLAGSIAPYCDAIEEIDDLLTLRGLKLLYERNQG